MKHTAFSFALLGSLSASLCGQTFTAIAQNVTGTATKPGLGPVLTLPTASISVSPKVLTAGQSTTITWASTDGQSAVINGINAWLSGTFAVVPQISGTITLTVKGSGGTAVAATQVTVQPPNSPPPSTAPFIKFTDLNVGSGSGGDNGNGVYVRIFGDNFGTSKGSSTVTLGGSLITNCSHCSWSNTEIVAQLGSAASTGRIIVKVNGTNSNSVPFTVTPTTIVFVATNGSDSNSGTYAAPFKTWRAAFNSVTYGDNSSPANNTVIYLEPGVSVSQDDGRGYSAAVSTDIGGSSTTKQLALVGFPGGTATVGSLQVNNGIHGWGKYLTIADLTIEGVSSAIDDEAGDVRIVNNDISCPAPPSGIGDTACVLGETDSPGDTWVFQGNNVHDTGGNVNKTYHAVYFSTGVNHADVGWNTVGVNFKGYCRSIMFHASSGANLYDLHVHDNTITGGYCDAIGFASVDPSKGVVEAYNNVIAHVATAANPYGVANEAGIAINSDPAGSTSGTVQIYNNTVVDAGGYTYGNQNGCFGVVNSGAGISLINNICDQPNATEPYIESQSKGVSGSHNLWYGAGPAPSWDAAPITLQPLFLSTTNFALQSTSPALKAGTSSKVPTADITGSYRPSPPAIGAYQ